jgi:hypothetical protein
VRPAYLFLRSRRAGHTAVALAAVAALGWLAADWPLGATRASASALFRVLFHVSLAAAMVIGVSTHAPFGEMERTASRSLPALRFGHLAILLVWSLATLDLLTLGRDQPHAWLMPCRNLAGFTGMALLAARILGSRLSWVVPFGYAVIVRLTGAEGPAELAVWVWPLQPPADGAALASALGLLGAGLAAGVRFGPRDTRAGVE